MTTAATNKYNVRAIREELDSSARFQFWNRFRSTLQNMTGTELLRAVVLEKPRNSRGMVADQATLLHSLIQRCWKSGSANRGGRRAPVDVIDTIAKSVPEALLVQDPRSGRTPLHLAVDRDAPPPVVECLIRRDKSRRSLYIQDRNGDTPLLIAVRNDDAVDLLGLTGGGVVGLLLRYDADGSSLLISSRKKKRAPLLYVVTNELRYSRRRGGTVLDLSRLPDPVRLMLVRTHIALKKKDAIRTQVVESTDETEQQLGEKDGDCTDAEEEEAGDHFEWEDIDTASALRAAVGCSHFLGRMSSDVLTILFREAKEEGNLSTVLLKQDEGGNTPLHLLCSCADTEECLRIIIHSKDEGNDCSAVKSVGINGRTCEGDDGMNLMEYLIEKCPGILQCPNKDGDLPFHIAIRAGHSWEVIRLLSEAYPDAIHHSNLKEELPLHIALKIRESRSRSSVAREVWRLWPDALAQRDGETGLYPFQLPVANLFEGQSQSYEDQLEGLGSGYFFLRQMPDILMTLLPEENARASAIGPGSL